MRRRSPFLLLFGASASLIGLAWLGQVAGLFPGRDITGQVGWLVVGLAFLAVGVALVARGLGAGDRRTRRR